MILIYLSLQIATLRAGSESVIFSLGDQLWTLNQQCQCPQWIGPTMVQIADNPTMPLDHCQVTHETYQDQIGRTIQRTTLTWEEKHIKGLDENGAFCWYYEGQDFSAVFSGTCTPNGAYYVVGGFTRYERPIP